MASEQELPTVTLITPTWNQNAMIPLAVYGFLNTDYPAEKLEWVIVDDGPSPVRELLPDDDRIRYFYYNQGEVKAMYTAFREKAAENNIRIIKAHSNWFFGDRIPMGMKRNLCVGHATGDIILHFEPDVYYPPESVRTRVMAILGGQKKQAVCCTITNNYYPKSYTSFKSAPSKRKTSIEQQAVVASLGYTRKMWLKKKFDNQDLENEGEFFFKNRGGLLAEIPCDGVMVMIVHRGNIKLYGPINGSGENGWHFGKIEDKLFEFISKLV